MVVIVRSWKDIKYVALASFHSPQRSPMKLAWCIENKKDTTHVFHTSSTANTWLFLDPHFIIRIYPERLQVRALVLKSTSMTLCVKRAPMP